MRDGALGVAKEMVEPGDLDYQTGINFAERSSDPNKPGSRDRADKQFLKESEHIGYRRGSSPRSRPSGRPFAPFHGFVVLVLQRFHGQVWALIKDTSAPHESADGFIRAHSGNGRALCDEEEYS